MGGGVSGLAGSVALTRWEERDGGGDRDLRSMIVAAGERDRIMIGSAGITWVGVSGVVGLIMRGCGVPCGG